MNSNRRKKWVIGSLGMMAAMIFVIGTAGCSTQEPSSEAWADAADTKPAVKVIRAAKHYIGDGPEVVAEVAPSAIRDIVLKVEGEVSKVFKQRGEQVEKGETLFQLDAGTAARQKRKAELSLRSAQASLSKTQGELERVIQDQEKELNKLRNDYDEGLVDRELVEHAEKQWNQAIADMELSITPLQEQVELASIHLQEADQLLHEQRVIAPIQGVLTDLIAEPGMALMPGTKVGQIQQIDTVKIIADITEDEAELVRGKAELAFYQAERPEQLIKGKVIYLADIMDMQKRTYTLELEAAGTGLKPGMRVHLQLANQAEQTVLAVPSHAIVREGNDAFVFVSVDNHVEKRKIKPGRMNEAFQEVAEGLQPGEWVAVSGQHQLKDKQEVTIEKVEEE